MKKKLLITTDCFLPRWDGIARFLAELLPKIKKHFDITVIAPDFKGKPYTVKGVRIIRLPLHSIKFGDIHFSKFRYGIIKKEVMKNDLVFNQTLGPIGMCTVIAASGKKPILSYVHSIEWELASEGVKYFHTIVRLLVKRLTRYLYNKCSLLVLPSNEVKVLLERNGIKTKKEIIKLGVDVTKFKSPINKINAKANIGIKPDKFVIGFVGRFGREKDIPTLYKAFVKLHKKYNNLVLLLLVGTEEEKYKHKAIVMTGPQKNVVPYLQAMDVFVLPSLTETSSLSTMEAMACGVPVIATPVGNVKNYVKEGINGMIFPKKNSKILMEKIEEIMQDEISRREMGEEARASMEKNYNWKKTVRKIIKVMKGY